MASNIRLLIVDDHPAVRAGLVAMLALYPEFDIVAEAANGQDAVRLYREQRPDLTLMDVRLPGMDGIETLGSIQAVDVRSRVIMLSSEALRADVARAMEAGACGYLSKTLAHGDFARELRHAHEHGWCRPLTGKGWAGGTGMDQRLSGREREVLSCLRRGLSNADIGKALGISPETAITHVKSLLVKLGAANRTEAVTVGYETGLLRIGEASD